MKHTLEIENLSVEVNGKELLRDIHLAVPEGEVHALLGPNGSGKTSLMMAVMGYPKYEVVRGRILFRGEDVSDLDITQRGRLGIGVTHQRPPTMAGVTLRQILDYIAAQKPEHAGDAALMVKDFQMEAFLDRAVNEGLSGGEIKRSELLQLLALRPGLALLDEPDSGVDVESLELMGEMVDRLFSEETSRQGERRSGIIITHTAHMLTYIRADKAYVMLDGRIGCSGNPDLIFETISRHGYRECIRCIGK
jgi:Fe-S cluster assembly ATP-binding protein